MDKEAIQTKENNTENKEDKEDNKSKEKHEDDEGGVLITLVFYVFGFATLIGTNGLLNQLNFVEYFQKRINPFLSIVLLDNFSNIPLQLVILIKKKLFNLKKQLIASLIILSICLVAFPFVVYLLKNNFIGNFLTILIAIIVGVIGSLLKSGFYALGSFFPLKNIVSFSTGQGVSGIIMALLGLLIRYAINSGDDEKDLRNGALVFFGFSLLLSLIALLSLFYIYKSKYGQAHILDNEDKENDENKVKEKKENDNHDAKEYGSDRKIIHYKKEENIKSSENRNIMQQNNENSDHSKGEISFWELFKLLKEVNLLICYNYIIAYALYPYACKAQELFKSGEYRVNIIILLYSCCNTIGRYLMRFFKPTMRKTYIVILLRTIFIFTIIFNHYLYFSLKVNYNVTSTLLVINIVLFGISNGFATSICMGIAPTLLKDEIKGKAGASVSFSLSVGSAIGSCLAFGVEKIMKNIGEL